MAFVLDSLTWIGEKVWDLFKAMDPFGYIAVSKSFGKFLLYTGAAALSYYSFKVAKCLVYRSITFARSFFNARYYLDAKSVD